MSYSSATGPQACQWAHCRHTAGQGNHILGCFRKSEAKRWSHDPFCLLLARLHPKQIPVWVPAPCSGETRRNQRLLRWSALDRALAIVLPGNKQQTLVILGFDMQSLPCKDHDIFGKTSVWLLGTLQKQAEYSESL